MIGPGGGRDLLSALVFGATHVDGVEINPIIARDVMLDRFREYSGGIYAHPRVSSTWTTAAASSAGAPSKYDVIQASLVDTWAATAAGAYTLTENSLYTSEAFGEYLDHLSDSGYLTITRWVFDGLRLVSLAQEACEARGLDPAQHLAIVRLDRVATFLLKKTPFTHADVQRLRTLSNDLGFSILYAPGVEPSHAGGRAGRDAAQRHERRRLSPADPGGGSGAFPRDLSARRPGHDRRSAVLLPHDASARTSSRWRSGGRCSSATA